MRFALFKHLHSSFRTFFNRTVAFDETLKHLMLALFVEDSSSTTVAFAQTFKILSKFGEFMNEDFEGVLFLQKRAKNSHSHRGRV